MADSFSLLSGERSNHDVFLSFRGQDTRKIFVGHLHKALGLKGIRAYIDSEDLSKGDDLSDLLKAIEGSMVSIVVFSQNYASSSWCLKELVQILECMAAKKQSVVPVFYEVDPSDIRKLDGSFAVAFAEHEQNPDADKKEVSRWKTALKEASYLSGWDSRKYRDDAKFIEDIVEDISKKLNNIASNRRNGLSRVVDLVGMDFHRSQMRTLLCLGDVNVRVVGVCGMPGIGKTTIARAVYDELIYEFEHCCFLENVKEGFKNFGANHMKEELISRVFENTASSVKILSRETNMMMDRLKKKKLLLVLDDVETYTQIEVLLGKKISFGYGSIVIITTRDIQSLSGIDARYTPRFLSDDEALKLFMQYAFRTNQDTREYESLLRRAVEYARGLPLALKVLGAFLDNKNKCAWEAELKKLKETPHADIQGVLRTGFDGLDLSQKDIFLDVSCFFRGMDRGFVTNILEVCGFYPDSGLRVLLDRALLTISDDRLEMHDLIQDMGREIVREQSIKEPGKRSRLWINEDIEHVLAENTATDAVEGIMLELSNSKEVNIDAKAFVRMTNLRLLSIAYNHSIDFKDYPLGQLDHQRGECKQHVDGEVEFLSQNLRYFMWHGCPLKFLPSNFCAKNLVYLDMRNSHIECLWEGTKPCKKLKFIKLSQSHDLTATPDFTEATNLEALDLEGCSSLHRLHPSILSLKNLVSLCLKGCIELQSLPSSICLKSLKTLDLSGCSRFIKFPDISGIMDNLLELYLNETAIEELPSSIDMLQGLALLNLGNCRSLIRLPGNICDLTHLIKLIVTGCSKLHHLPENLGNLKSLVCLEVEGSGIIDLPFSILHLNKLRNLSCDGCKQMEMPLSSWSSRYPGLSHLQHLHLSDCNLRELSEGVSELFSLETLDLRRNNLLEALPATMNQLRYLTRLELEGCASLKSVPELSSSISYINAHDCKALINVAKPRPRRSTSLVFTFSNCLQLVHTNLFREIVESYFDPQVTRSLSLKMSLPGDALPDWFNHQSPGSSVTLQLPTNWSDNGFLGFAICAVYDFKCAQLASDLSAQCRCTFSGNHGEHSFSFTLLDWGFSDRILASNHMFLGYAPWSEYQFIKNGKLASERYYTHATFEIVLEVGLYILGQRTRAQPQRITMCGARLFHANYMEPKSQNDTSPALRKRHRETEGMSELSLHRFLSTVAPEVVGERSSAWRLSTPPRSSVGTGERSSAGRLSTPTPSVGTGESGNRLQNHGKELGTSRRTKYVSVEPGTSRRTKSISEEPGTCRRTKSISEDPDSSPQAVNSKPHLQS